jgi:hypothetical protein
LGGVDGDGGRANSLPKQLFSDQTAVRVTDDHRRLVKPINDVGVVTGDVVDTDVGDVLGVLPGFSHRAWLSWPAGRDGVVSGFPEQLQPRAPAGRVQPKAVDEDDGGWAHRIRLS